MVVYFLLLFSFSNMSCRKRYNEDDQVGGFATQVWRQILYIFILLSLEGLLLVYNALVL